MSDNTKTLKAWCHWKKLEKDLAEDDLEFAKAIEDTISQVNNYKTRFESLETKHEKYKSDAESFAVSMADTIELLEAKLQQAKSEIEDHSRRRNSALHMSARSWEENKKYRKALEFYAEWNTPLYTLADGELLLITEFGDTARKALVIDEETKNG